ncbi:MAG: glycoside hydrolase family 28 protein [Candidatus Marinimicrobia bacterium]|nr:glycoside hydrolase family 28 protein [Candidatus Neomarinimicrobiota bacterium]MCF7827413.1 glycoside hydrolase family 28 protein [Candidatus Neomarinimicrobiota bacterium]MCF7881354.1 glycoside hydrolase family 28 protein [Candidatus Neomarinimicrobiota bacterium]
MNQTFLTRIAKVLLLTLITAGLVFAGNTEKSLEDYFQPVPQKYYEGVQFDMPEVPVPTFPDYTVSIEDFGAVPDGETLNTQAFEDAISDVADEGGGTVIVPRGLWLTGPIKLQSNVNMHLQKGAFIHFSDDYDLYPLIKTSYEGQDAYRCTSPLTMENVENVAVTGHGIIDGSGGAWRPVKKFKMTDGQWEELLESGGYLNEEKDIWYPTKGSLRGNTLPPDSFRTRENYEAIKVSQRPVMVSIRGSKNILLDGPTFQNSPAWNIHPLMSEDLVIRNLTVRNPWFSQNGDGLDLESCKNAFVYNNNFDVGDDAICLKSGKNEAGRERGIPTQNIVVRENVVYHGHGGFVVGSEMSGGIRNIHVSDLTFNGTDVGVRFKSTRGRGGTVEDIYISDIDMVDIVTEPIRFNLFYGGKAPTPGQNTEVVDKEKLKEEIPPVTVETPRFRDIHIKNIVCRGAGSAMWIQGLPEMNVQNMALENIRITSTNGASVIDVDELTLKNVEITAKNEPVFYLNNGTNVDLRDVSLTYLGKKEAESGVRVEGPFTENIMLRDISLENIANPMSHGPNVERSAVVQE